MRKSQVVWVGLVSAWLGLQRPGVPGQGGGFCPADSGEPWTALEHRSDVAQAGLTGDSSGRSSGEGL